MTPNLYHMAMTVTPTIPLSVVVAIPEIDTEVNLLGTGSCRKQAEAQGTGGDESKH